MAHTTNGSLPLAQKHDSRVCFGIFVVGFSVLLPIALVAQMLFVSWRPWFPGAEGEKSLIGGVKAAVYTFMSHLH